MLAKIASCTETAPGGPMDFELSEEHRMMKDLVARFVRDELMPLEAKVLAREAEGQGLGLGAAEHARLDAISKELGLWGLDAPEDIGGADLPAMAMVGIEEELGRTITPYTLPPDSPNLRMLMATVNERQRAAYLRRDHLGDRHFRARRRRRSGRHDHPRGTGRGRLDHQRPQDLDLQSRRRRLHYPDGRHRQGKARPRRHLRLPGR
jgi:hypothetical protein